MKVCRKCKSHLTNKAKICVKCGADVSKARILKNVNIQVKQSVKCDNIKCKTISDSVNLEKVSVNRSFDVFYVLINFIKLIYTEFNYIGKRIALILLCFFKFCFVFIKNIFILLLSKRLFLLKFSFCFIMFAFISCFGFYFGVGFYDDVDGDDNSSAFISQKASVDKVFYMNDVINYNGVYYKIDDVKIFNGNKYKAPKVGNQFLVVTVTIINNTNERIGYSYENFTMSNSLGDEKKNLFTSINSSNALYSGELAIGATKTGSMVFEQPINDPKLKINYYDLMSDSDNNEIADKSKRIFSISMCLDNAVMIN